MRQKVAALLLLALARLLASATIQGSVYDAGTLDLVERAVVEVNTVPAQSKVTQDGGYAFELEEGNYTLTAETYAEGKLALCASAYVEIGPEGTYEIDLLLFPRDDFFPQEEYGGELAGVDEELPEGFGTSAGGPARETHDAVQSALAAILFFALALAIWKSARHESPGAILAKEKNAWANLPKKAGREATKPRVLVLEPEQKRALSLLSSSGGHMTQKELRSKLPYSEAKVSLILTELESMGALKRFKRGRGNIIKLLRK